MSKKYPWIERVRVPDHPFDIVIFLRYTEPPPTVEIYLNASYKAYWDTAKQQMGEDYNDYTTNTVIQWEGDKGTLKGPLATLLKRNYDLDRQYTQALP